MLLSIIFQLYRGGQFFFGGGNRVPGENHRSAASHWQTCYIKLYRVHLAMSEIRNKVSNGLSLFLLLLCITIKKKKHKPNKAKTYYHNSNFFKF
jgi:hypothetical protein